MTLKDVKIGEKFIANGNSFLRIDFDLSNFSLTKNFNGFVCALDLNTYKIVCFKSTEEIVIQ